MRHHYVPQFLLAPWARDNADKKIEVFRLDIAGLPSSRRTPKHTGFEEDLYALTVDKVAGMEKQTIEKQFLMRIDNNGARIRNKLENDGLKSLTPKDMADWARFVMSLRIRQPNIITSLQADATEHLKEMLNEQPEEYEELISDDAPKTLEEWTKQQFPGLIENIGLSFFHELVDNPDIGNKILNMRWWIWDFSDSPYELLLSDNPCIFTSGIDDPNCIFALPISPRKVFLATQSDNVAQILRQQSTRDLSIRINESSVSQSQTRIFARQQFPVRSFIENRLSTNKR